MSGGKQRKRLNLEKSSLKPKIGEGSLKNSKNSDDLMGTRVVEDFYAIDGVVGWKGEGRNRRYLVRWKGLTSEHDTWLAPRDLCQTTLEEAHQLVRRDQSAAKNIGGNTKAATKNTIKSAAVSQSSIRATSTNGVKTASKKVSSKKPSSVLGSSKTGDINDEQASDPLASDERKLKSTGGANGVKKYSMSSGHDDRPRNFKRKLPSDSNSNRNRAKGRRAGLEKKQTTFRYKAVERISVLEKNARERVTAARRNGIPVVLTGQLGWPQFAARWLHGADQDQPLDLSKPNELDISQLIHDIGDERVPVVAKKYNEKNPIEHEMTIKDFVAEFWPPNGTGALDQKKLYLQQWQFPNSKSASKVLCGENKCSSLSKSVFFEDLLPFWLNNGENPYQYLFMGDSGTMSKLHNDPGGLEILIAPIVGIKECILAHRDDVEYYLYDTQVQLDNPDLDQFPRAAFARIWKTEVCPGEILLMPYNTYHQVRNSTPCLSYHRLHLDVVNMPGFLESMDRGDATELQHSEVVWNVSHGLMARIDEFVDCYRRRKGDGNGLVVTETIQETVNALEMVRHVSVEIIRLFMMHSCGAPVGIEYSADSWAKQVFEIDKTLYEFQNRDLSSYPRFRPRRWTFSNTPQGQEEDEFSSDEEEDEEMVQYSGSWSLRGIFQTIHSVIDDTPAISRDDENRLISDKVSLRPGDTVAIRLSNRLVRGTIERTKEEMQAALVTYNGLPSSFDEYKTAKHVHGLREVSNSAIPTALKPSEAEGGDVSKRVRCTPSGTDGKLREAVVLSSKTATFYFVHLLLPGVCVKRWFIRSSFIRKEQTIEI